MTELTCSVSTTTEKHLIRGKSTLHKSKLKYWSSYSLNRYFQIYYFCFSVDSVAQQYSNYVFSYEYINIFFKVIWGEKDIESYLKFSHSMISKIKNIKTFISLERKFIHEEINDIYK